MTEIAENGYIFIVILRVNAILLHYFFALYFCKMKKF